MLAKCWLSWKKQTVSFSARELRCCVLCRLPNSFYHVFCFLLHISLFIARQCWLRIHVERDIGWKNCIINLFIELEELFGYLERCYFQCIVNVSHVSDESYEHDRKIEKMLQTSWIWLDQLVLRLFKVSVNDRCDICLEIFHGSPIAHIRSLMSEKHGPISNIFLLLLSASKAASS